MNLREKVGGLLRNAVVEGKLSFYNSVRLYVIVNRFFARKRSRSVRFSSKVMLKHIANATAPSSKNAWTSVLFPAEILYPFGVYPITLEVLAGMFSTLDLSKRYLDLADAVGTPNTMCSFHRVLLGLSTSGDVERPLFVGATSTLCDGNVKSFGEVARKQSVPFVFIDVPYEMSEDGVAYIKGQLKHHIEQMSDLTGIKLESMSLVEMASKVNKAFSLARQYYRLRIGSYSNVSQAHEVANFVFPMHFLLGSDQLIDVLEEKCLNEKDMSSYNRFFKSKTFSRKAMKLMWLHIVPQYDTELWSIIDGGNISRIVCDDYSSPYYEDYDLDDPLGSIARRLISHPSNGPLERRIDHILKVARENRVDGIVHYSSWGCHQASGNVQMLGRAIEDAGYRFININGDAVDKRNSSPEQVRTRLEAFLEGFPSPNLSPKGRGIATPSPLGGEGRGEGEDRR